MLDRGLVGNGLGMLLRPEAVQLTIPPSNQPTHRYFTTRSNSATYPYSIATSAAAAAIHARTRRTRANAAAYSSPFRSTASLFSTTRPTRARAPDVLVLFI